MILRFVLSLVMIAGVLTILALSFYSRSKQADPKVAPLFVAATFAGLVASCVYGRTYAKDYTGYALGVFGVAVLLMLVSFRGIRTSGG